MKPVFTCLLSVLVASVTLSAVSDTPPSAEEQARLLVKLRQSVGLYLENLPNLVCSRVTEQYQAGKKAEHWRRLDTITDRLIFNQGTENFSPELLNGKPIPPGRYLSRPLETSGEFGDLVSTVLSQKSAAQISFSHWEDLRGRRLAVFTYLIDARHSSLSLGLTGLFSVLPYRGQIFIDPESGDLWRITSAPFDMPPQIETKSLTTTIDYGLVDITTKRFILPVSASISLDTGAKNILNKISFTEYRRFETDSKITFVSGSN